MNNNQYFKIRAIYRKKADGASNNDKDCLIEAKDEAQAKEKFIKEWLCHQNESVEEYDLFIEKAKIEELIDNEQKMLYQRLVGKYIDENYGDISISELNTILQSSNKSDKDRMLYNELKAHLNRLRISEYLEKRLDTEKLTHAEFCKIRDMLCNATDQDEIIRINKEITTKYGKGFD